MYKIINFPIHGDSRGNLVALEKGADFPFDIKRVYYIWGTQSDVIRGKHAHKKLEQVIVCLSGSCDFLLDDGRTKENIHLDNPAQGLYIKNNVWREFSNFSENCVLMVMASDYYDEKDYIRDYHKFQQLSGGGGYILIRALVEKYDEGLNLVNLPENIQRAFYIWGCKGSDKRGCHANKNSQFWLICISGSCSVDVSYKGKKETFDLNDKTKILYLDKMVWKEMYNFSNDAVLLVLSDRKFDPTEYIRNRNELVRV